MVFVFSRRHDQREREREVRRSGKMVMMVKSGPREGTRVGRGEKQRGEWNACLLAIDLTPLASLVERGEGEFGERERTFRLSLLSLVPLFPSQLLSLSLSHTVI